MYKNILTTLIVISMAIGLTSLTGCSYYDKKLAKNQNIPTQREQKCSDIKRDLTFGGTDIRTDDNQRDMPNYDAESLRQFRKNDCKNLENKKSNAQ